LARSGRGNAKNTKLKEKNGEVEKKGREET